MRFDLPTPDAETRPFWDAAKNGKLVIQYCKDTGKPQFFPRPVSLANGKRNLEWREVSGRGTVYTYTVTYQNQSPGFREELPYVLAYVELEKGVRLLTNIVGCAPAQVRIGMPVQVSFEDVTPEVTLPKFRPAGDSPHPSPLPGGEGIRG